MSIKITDLSEKIRIKHNKITIRTKIFGGKQGDFFVYVSPSLNISGYGKTSKDAKESLKLNLELFCSDIMALPMSEIDRELKHLGFKKEMYHNKNYSKVFVDENGVLQGFDEETTTASMLEVAL